MEERDGFSDGEVSGSFFFSQELGVSGWMFLSPGKNGFRGISRFRVKFSEKKSG